MAQEVGKTPAIAARSVWRDRAADLAIRALIRTALGLPLGVRLALMGRVICMLAPRLGWQDRALANLAHVWPDRSETERRAIAQAAADNAGRTLIENYDPKGLIARMARASLRGEGLPAIEAARAEGRPVLFVTGHYGNFEAPRAALVAQGYRIGGLYRPMANPYFNAHYAANMHTLSDPVFEQGRRGTAGLVRHIRSGGMGVLLFDVYDSAGEPLDFLGQPAPTLLSAAEIALRTNALLVPFFGIRKRDGRNFDCVFEAPIPHGDPRVMMESATARLAARIEQDPGQWFWIHRRWKPQRQARRQREHAADGPGTSLLGD